MYIVLCVLTDGRLVSGSNGGLLIIYNKNIYQPYLMIKEHNAKKLYYSNKFR